jgi:hypothetical protein
MEVKNKWEKFNNGSFQKRSVLPPQRKFLPSGGGGDKKLFLIIVNVLGHPKGVGGLTSYFLCGGGMVVWMFSGMTQHLLNNKASIDIRQR